MDPDAISAPSSDSSLSLLHRQISHLEGWFEIARQSGQDHWYSSALTRIALLVGDDEVRWVYGNRDGCTLVVLTPGALIVCERPASANDQYPASVYRVPRTSVRKVELQGGASAFGNSIYRDWPGRVEVVLHLGERLPIHLDVHDFRNSKVADAWGLLIPSS